eukprot:gene9665-9824_t
MTNPPVFHNPLRRRGCCDHSYSTELTNYRAEAIKRDLLAQEQVEQQRRRVQSLNDLQAVAILLIVMGGVLIVRLLSRVMPAQGGEQDYAHPCAGVVPQCYSLAGVQLFRDIDA